MRKQSIIFSLIVGLLPALSSAQSGRTIKFRTLCFEHKDGIKEVLVPVPGEKGGMTTVPLYTSDFSDPLQMKINNGVAVFSVENPQATGDKDRYKPVGTAKVPASSQILFLFLPAKKESKLPYRVIALADDLRAAPWRSVRMLNISPVPARFNLGEYSGKNAKTVAPGKMAIIPKVRKLNKYNNYNVIIEFKGKNGFVGVSNTRWKSVDGKRDLAIAYYDPVRKRPVVKLYSDIQPAKLD